MTEPSMLTDSVRVGVLWKGCDGLPGIPRLESIQQRFATTEWVIVRPPGMGPIPEPLASSSLWVTTVENEDEAFFDYITHLLVFDNQTGYEVPEYWKTKERFTHVYKR